ncbi:MAG TPA: transposase [Gammaproteobacteria bacterium]|nr:transposase [Gammaproteobacteria bacterium]
MPDHRRARTPGGRYFFTLTLQHRRRELLTRHIGNIYTAIGKVLATRPVSMDALVILPDHLHTLWTLPTGDDDYPTRWALIKGLFSRSLPRGRGAGRGGRRRKGERNIWQRRFWEQEIRNDKDYRLHFDYIHIDPVKHGLVARVADWPWSSFHKYVADGVYPEDWAGDGRDYEGVFGETGALKNRRR